MCSLWIQVYVFEITEGESLQITGAFQNKAANDMVSTLLKDITRWEQRRTSCTWGHHGTSDLFLDLAQGAQRIGLVE
jgi:hypothetical protein